MEYTKETFEEYLSFWTNKSDDSGPVNEDVLVFIGPTKGGKSTLINCLMKNDLLGKQSEASGSTKIVKGDENDNGPKIGTLDQSESLLPQSYGNLIGTNLLMYDFPGFGDNKGSRQEIANALGIKAVICQQKSVRFALVVPFNLIKQKDPLPFFKLLHSLVNISPNIAEHLCLIASKYEKGNLKLILQNLYESSFSKSDDDNMELIQTAKAMIKVLIDNDAFILFKSPVMDDDVWESVYKLSNEDDFKKCFQNLEGIQISECHLVLSDTAQCQLSELYQTIYCSLKSCIEAVANDLRDWTQKNICDGNSIETSQLKINFFKDNIKKLKLWKERSKELGQLLQFLDFIESCTAAVKVSNHFNSLESLYNQSQPRIIYGEKEFYHNIICQIDGSITLFNNEIVKSDPSQTQLTSYEERLFRETQDEAALLSWNNVKFICGKIWNFYQQNKNTINGVIVSAITAIMGRFSR